METTTKPEKEKTIEINSPRDWKFQTKTTERKLKKILIFLKFLVTRLRKNEEKQAKRNVKDERKRCNCPERL